MSFSRCNSILANLLLTVLEEQTAADNGSNGGTNADDPLNHNLHLLSSVMFYSHSVSPFAFWQT